MGEFEFVISMLGEPTDWMTSGSTGSLYRFAEGNAVLLWSRNLPHEYRPRFAFVDDHGSVVLLDQWINVAGPHAVTVVNESGTTIAAYDFSDIAGVLGIPGREIIPLAKQGSWMSEIPKPADGYGAVRAPAGGKVLIVAFASGDLSLEQQ